MKPLVLFPFNGNAREAVQVIDAINRTRQSWDLRGFLDDDPAKRGSTLGGYPVLGPFEDILAWPDCSLLAVPGRPDALPVRRKLLHDIVQQLPPARLATCIHPSAAVGTDCCVGYNVLIMNNVVLTASVRVGNNVIILPNSVIAHDCEIGDNVIIGSNVSVSGGVTVGANCYIGTGAKIIQEVTIGEGSIIGIGSVAIRDVPAKSIYVGNPAVFLRDAQ